MDQQKKIILSKWLKQIGWILFYFSVFLGCAGISWFFKMGVIQTISKKWMLLEAGLFSSAWLIWLILWRWCNKGKISSPTIWIKGIIEKVKGSWHICIVLLVALFQRIWMMGTMQRWDSAEYYYKLGNGCSNFTFSATSFLRSFRLCLHPTYGMALFTAPGEFLNFRGMVGVQICTLILTLAAVFCLYELFGHFYCRMSKGKAAISALFCACLPLFWGTFAYYNPDYFIAVFFIFFVYSEYKKEYISMAFWGIMTSQCKETGIIIIFGYAAFRVLITLFASKEQWGKRLISQLKDGGNWGSLCVGASYLVYSKFNGGMTSWTTVQQDEVTSFTWNNEGFNCFGINKAYIMEHLKQLFVMNYAWILWACIIVFVVIVIVLVGKKQITSVNIGNLSGTMGAGVIYSLFVCLYITHPIYRYNVIWVLISGVLFIILFHLVTEKVSVWKWIIPLGICTFVVGSQSIINTDPISKRVIDTVDTGKRDLLFSSGGSNYYGDYLVYNYEYSWLDKAFDQMMEDGGYDEDTIIYIVGTQASGAQLEGYTGRCSVNWDTQEKQRTFSDNKDTIPIRAYFEDSVLKWGVDYYIGDPDYNDGKIATKALVFFIPYYQIDEAVTLDFYRGYYSIGDRKQVTNLWGELGYYELELRQEYR